MKKCNNIIREQLERSRASLFECDFHDVKKVIFHDRLTVVILHTGERGKTRLHPGVENSFDTGFWCAYAKALRKKNRQLKELTRDNGLLFESMRKLQIKLKMFKGRRA